MPMPISSKAAPPMKAQTSSSLQTISAGRYLAATMPRAGSTCRTVPGPAQPDASLVLGGLWIST
eukprot:4188929-Pyramimonas_sp.AAC.1